jgi:hypothetical protein
MLFTLKSNTKKIRTGKFSILLYSALIVLILGVTAALLYWHTHKNAIIKNKIEKAIAATNDGFYKISYQDMQVNEDSGSLSVLNMNVFYDSLDYVLAEQNDEVPPMLFRIYIPEIHVEGVKTQRALLNKEITGRKLEIKNPVVDLQYTYRGKDSIRNVPTSEIYRQLLGNLDLVQMDTILITGAQFRTSNKRTGKLIIAVNNITISLLNVRIDSLAYADSSRLLFAKNMNIQIDKIAWTSSSGLYHYRASTILLNSNTGDLRINEFLFKPALNENAFVNAIPTQDDRFDFAFKNITLSGLDVSRLTNEYLDARSLTVGSARFNIYRDLARPRDKKNRVGCYPHQILEKIPMLFNIRSLNILNAFLEYKERNNITRQSGKVQFYNVSGSLSNFTNDRKKITENNMMRATITSSFLNKTPFKTNWIFYLLHPKGRFSLSGSVGAMDATQLNPLTEPMGPASIKKGYLNGVEFNLEGNNYNMSGDVKVLYKDLKVDLLEKDKGATETDKKFLMSFLANIVIKNDNPKNNEEARSAKLSHARDINRSIFNLCWKTLFEGIRETVGIRTKQ